MAVTTISIYTDFENFEFIDSFMNGMIWILIAFTISNIFAVLTWTTIGVFLNNFIKSDKAIKQKLTLEMLQNKFSQGAKENERLKKLLLSIINNLKTKKLSAPELKLWKRAQVALNDLARHLP